MKRRSISPRSLPTEATTNGAAFRPNPGPPLVELDFDDDTYRRYPMTAQEQWDSERRLEFWDGETETALEVREGPTAYHEWPSHRLAQLVERIAQVRGKPIACYGTMDLEFPTSQGWSSPSISNGPTSTATTSPTSRRLRA